jgi:hypothetical protein
VADETPVIPPCRHFSDIAPSGCWLPGRCAPHDCGLHCTAYSEDLAAALSLDAIERVRVDAWNNAVRGR